MLSGRERERRHDRKREREKERERREREIEREFYLKHSIRGGLGRRPRRTPQGEEEGLFKAMRMRWTLGVGRDAGIGCLGFRV